MVSALASVVAGVAGAVVALGVTGFGVVPEPVPAPVLLAPFTAADPAAGTSGFRGDAAVPEGLGADELSIPSVGLRMPVVPAAAGDGSVVVPASDTAGLYTGTAPLSSGVGTTLVVGHVNFTNGASAPMALITKIGPGALIFLTDHAGKVHSFTATSAQSYPKGHLPEKYFNTTGERQLVLVTCTDLQFVDGQWEFTGNITITATPMKGMS